MDIDTSLKRMDSMMIEANIKKLSCTELIYTSIRDVLKDIDLLDSEEEMQDTQKQILQELKENKHLLNF